jgi:hypothetical protein
MAPDSPLKNAAAAAAVLIIATMRHCFSAVCRRKHGLSKR